MYKNITYVHGVFSLYTTQDSLIHVKLKTFICVISKINLSCRNTNLLHLNMCTTPTAFFFYPIQVEFTVGKNTHSPVQLAFQYEVDCSTLALTHAKHTIYIILVI